MLASALPVCRSRRLTGRARVACIGFLLLVANGRWSDAAAQNATSQDRVDTLVNGPLAPPWAFPIRPPTLSIAATDSARRLRVPGRAASESTHLVRFLHDQNEQTLPDLLPRRVLPPLAPTPAHTGHE